MSANISKCECWFLDVGQGTSNVIFLEDGRSIVIDTGPKGSTQTLELLNQFDPKIELLIISHNDEDHDFNTPRILTHFRNKINKVCFLDCGHQYNQIGVLTALCNCPELQDEIPEIVRLEAGPSEQVLFSENGIRLVTLYPNLYENTMSAQYGKRMANTTSAVLLLECQNKKILYSSDTSIEAWDSLAKRYPMPIECEIATIPHHGGMISKSPGTEIAAQNKLYGDYIHPNYGIISVGSYNTYGHPCNETIKVLNSHGINVLCTQITPGCCVNLEDARLNKRAISKYSRSDWKIKKTASGKHSKDVACFGSVTVLIEDKQIHFENHTSHQAFLSDLKKAGNTLKCD